MKIHVFILMCFCLLVGVFGDEVKSVSVMEGESVTLNTDVTHIQTHDVIEWRFKYIRIARIKRSFNINPTYDDNDETEIFRNKLKMNNQTGDLTITHITSQHSGVYQVDIFSGNIERFSLTVYAPLPVPVISRVSSQCSLLSSTCSVLCSVLNVTHVSLSWYKGNSLLSSISVSDLNIRLSLHLEVEYQDTNTYTCVINNHITNQTQHLHIKQLCHKCPALIQLPMGAVVGVAAAVGVAAVVGVVAGAVGYHRYHQQNLMNKVPEPQEIFPIN